MFFWGKYINQQEKYIFPSSVYIFLPEKYVFLSFPQLNRVRQGPLRNSVKTGESAILGVLGACCAVRHRAVAPSSR